MRALVLDPVLSSHPEGLRIVETGTGTGAATVGLTGHTATIAAVAAAAAAVALAATGSLAVLSVLLLCLKTTVRTLAAKRSNPARDWSHRIGSAPAIARRERSAPVIAKEIEREIERVNVGIEIGTETGRGIVCATATATAIVTVTGTGTGIGIGIGIGRSAEIETANVVKRIEQGIESAPTAIDPSRHIAITLLSTVHTGPNARAKTNPAPKTKKSLSLKSLLLNPKRIHIHWNARPAIANASLRSNSDDRP